MDLQCPGSGDYSFIRESEDIYSYIDVTFPHMTELFDSLGIETEASDVSFSASLDRGVGYEWGSRNGLRSLFSQKSNLLKPNFWKMLRELKKFKDDAMTFLCVLPFGHVLLTE
uniref:Cyclopropane-fatty-acyl-phospholipid synthase n=1 Tax=Opuntia streptacantha TaxID=393608 RepID=A0A7C9ACN1_OPUST